MLTAPKIFTPPLHPLRHHEAMELIGLFLSLGLLVYLIVALLQPERFS